MAGGKERVLEIQHDGTVLLQLAADEVEPRRREPVLVLHQDGPVRQVRRGAVLFYGLARRVGDQGADLPRVQQADDGPEARDGVAPQRPDAEEAAILPLQPGAGQDEGDDGAGDEREGDDQAG